MNRVLAHGRFKSGWGLPAGTLASGRPGLTLIEVLCVIGVFGLLVSLMIPAVAASRESARRTQCANHLRQLALACHAFHDAHGTLPRQNFNAVPSRYLEPPGAVSAWGQLLPYLGEQNLFAQIDLNETGIGSHREPPTSEINGKLLNVPVPVLLCPSDIGPPGACNMRICLGSRAGSPYGTSKGAFFSLGRFRRTATFQMITDGLSQTALCSERVVGDFDPTRWSPTRDAAFVESDVFSDPDFVLDFCSRVTNSGSFPHASSIGATWLLNGHSTVAYNHVAPPNSPISDCTNAGYSLAQAQVTARSMHPGGINAATADGAVRFVGNSIDIGVWRALGTRAGND